MSLELNQTVLIHLKKEIKFQKRILEVTKSKD